MLKFCKATCHYRTVITDTYSKADLPFPMGRDHHGRTKIDLNIFPLQFIEMSKKMLSQTILSLSLINPVGVENHRFACCVEERA